MRYVGIQTQIRRNNMLSILLLILFPVILLAMVWAFLAALNYFGNGYYDQYGNVVHQMDVDTVNYYFLQAMPWVVGAVALWFCISYFSNTSMIRKATGAHSITRRENPRVYNIVENLCMTCGMEMPQINVVDDPQLNAFASGIDKKSYTVTVTTGLLNKLDDNELAGVLGHELTHIRNNDTRLLITSIIFVGILATVTSIVVNILRNMFFYGGGGATVTVGGGNSDGERKNNNGVAVIVVLLIALVCCAVGYFFTIITRFAISRKREYMADAGGAELCGDPLALASALRKISNDPGLQDVGREDVAQLFIIHPQAFTSMFSSLFSTHPDTAKRIQLLEQF